MFIKGKWDSDIDIYVSIPSFSEMERFLQRKRDTKSSVKRDSDGMYNNVDEIKYIETYTINRIKVQIIHVDSKDLSDFILRTFDFDFVKNIFFQNKVSIFNYEEIFSQVVKFKIGSAPLTNAIKRARKYEKRGFTFQKNSEYVELIKLYYETESKIKIIESREINDMDILCKCSDNCIIKFFYPENKHSHVKYFLKYKHGDKVSETYIKSIIVDISLKLQIPSFPKEKILAKNPNGGYYGPSYHKLKDNSYLSSDHISILNE